MIYTKLLKFQQLGITLDKDGANPHFKSAYPTLNEVLSKLKKPLNDLGILILQIPEKDGLRTRLINTERTNDLSKADPLEAFPPADYVECFMPYVDTTTPQKLVSNNTYNRRVSLVTLLGLEDEDDDGQVASTPVYTKGKAKEEGKDIL